MISQIIFKILLTLSSTFLIATIYFIKQEYIFFCLNNNPKWVSYLIIALAPLFLSIITLCCKKFLSTACIESLPLAIGDATNSFLPSYLGYFFVALSINSDQTFWWIFVILFLFVFHSQTIYFNPIFLIFRYKFYYVTTSTNKKIFVITKIELSEPNDLVNIKLKSINNFTYIGI